MNIPALERFPLFEGSSYIFPTHKGNKSPLWVHRQTLGAFIDFAYSTQTIPRPCLPSQFSTSIMYYQLRTKLQFGWGSFAIIVITYGPISHYGSYRKMYRFYCLLGPLHCLIMSLLHLSVQKKYEGRKKRYVTEFMMSSEILLRPQSRHHCTKMSDMCVGWTFGWFRNGFISHLPSITLGMVHRVG